MQDFRNLHAAFVYTRLYMPLVCACLFMPFDYTRFYGAASLCPFAQSASLCPFARHRSECAAAPALPRRTLCDAQDGITYSAFNARICKLALHIANDGDKQISY
jgi:hypothetical protein